MTYKIMLADDEPIMRKALRSLIDWERINCEIVYVAENGQEVLNALEEIQPDILITDIKMPGADGIEISKYIWEKRLVTKIILLTAYADFSYAQSAIRYNVVEYVTKTGAFDELLLAIERCKVLLAEKNIRVSEEKEAHMENFFRGVYDGNIYSNLGIRYEQLGLMLTRYSVLFFKFLMDDSTERFRRVRLYDSLKNFFHLAFSEQLIHGMFYKKDMYGLLLKSGAESEETKKSLEETCKKVMDMMDNFMELYVYVGISKVHDDMEELPDAYEEAQSALKHSWFEKSEKLNFYSDDMKNEIAPVISYDSKQKLVKESMEYIERHYYEPMSVGDIAKALGTSISYLSRIFKENTGETIIRTINNKRIEKAKAYLKETDYKVYEVADILGFENVTYFSRFFKKHTGMSPKEYKDQKGGRK